MYTSFQIDTVFETYDKFFALSLDMKEKYTKKEGTSPNGWDALERERCVLIVCFIVPVIVIIYSDSFIR